MIRISDKQGALVRSMASSSNIAKAARCKPVLSEADVTRQITDFLRARGWLLKRQQSGLFQRPGSTARVRIGEVGEADWMAMRIPSIVFVPRETDMQKFRPIGYVQVFFFEVKATGKRPSYDQCLWLETRRRLGFQADCFASLDHFEQWYSLRFA